jgi:hypothetical protein
MTERLLSQNLCWELRTTRDLVDQQPIHFFVFGVITRYWLMSPAVCLERSARIGGASPHMQHTDGLHVGWLSKCLAGRCEL